MSKESVQGFLFFWGICLVVAIPLMAFILVSLPMGHEVWLLESIREMHQSFVILPELNHIVLRDANP
ncbi:MAG: hypothetical protein U9P80_05660, partial [Thermodesulfobacteriota bacterium]|nr:hypothetical protein [Thermodesulfobacteriota bacterium]